MSDHQPSNAWNFFEKLTAKSDAPLEHVHGLVSSTPKTFENEWRDFKGQPKDDDDTKRIWSKALAGFANTGGGVVVWGIDSRKVDGIDAASGFRLITDPPVFLSRLKELLPEATDPPVQGVEMEYLTDASEGSHGFVVCFVPESTSKPHRAEFSDRQYYIRVSDRFEICPPPLLRSLFAAKGQCRFEFHGVAKFERNPVHQAMTNLRFAFSLMNTGTESARDLVIRVRAPRPVYPSDSYWEHVREGNGALLVCKKPLHPGQVIPAYAFDCGLVDFNEDEKCMRKGPQMSVTMLDLFARDAHAQSASLIFTNEEIVNRLHKRTGFLEVRYSNPLQQLPNSPPAYDVFQ